MTSVQHPVFVRRAGAYFAAVLGLMSAWIVAAELLRPDIRDFPADAAEAQAAKLNRTSAATAAWSGWPRGALWTDFAVAANASLIDDALNGRPIRAGSGADDVAETAATLSPSDARNWVVLAVNAQSAADEAKALAQLKISYYTAPFNDRLFPLRLQIVARSSRAADEELNGYIEYELGVIIGHKPELKPAVASAYRTASPAGRSFLDHALAKLDPKFLTEVKAAGF